MSPADRMLFEQWRVRRDPDAFRRLMDQYAGMIYAVGRRITGNDQDAEDVAQAAFETLASQRRAPRVHLGAWLHRVATYRALSLRRGEARRRDREARYESSRARHVEPSWDDIYDLVDEAIAALPRKQREVIVAYYFEGRTHQAIALAAGVSRPAVTQRLQAGVEGIRKHLARRGVTVTLSALGGLLVQGATAAAPAPVLAQLGKIALAGYSANSGVMNGLWQAGWAWPGAAKAAVAVAVVAAAALGGQRLLLSGAPAPQAPIITETAESPATREAPEPPPEPAVPPVEADTPPAEAPVEWVSTFEAPPPVTVSVSGFAVDERGYPAPGAQVSASAINEHQQLIRKSMRASDEDGSFKLRNLPAGVVSLVAMPPGWYSRNAADEPGALVLDLRPGQNYTGARLTVPFSAYRSISGRVLDAAGRPIAGANVNAMNIRLPSNAGTRGVSDTDGSFEIPYLLIGHEFHLRAEAVGKSPATVDGVPAGSTGVDIVLAGVGAIEGQVVDAVTGAPLQAFGVRLGPLSPFGGGGNRASALDDRGHFRLEGVHLGSAELVVSANGYRTQSLHVRPVEEGKVLRDVVVPMEPRPDGTLEGWVLDRDRNPVVGAKIQLLPEAHGRIDRNAGSARSGRDGSFQLEGVGDDAAYVVAMHQDFALGKAAVPQADGAPVLITLERGGTVTGLVTIAGAPASGVRVHVREEATDSGLDATTGPDGTYRITGVIPGAARVAFNYGYNPMRDSRTGRVDTEVAAQGETVVDMAFTAATSALEGTVIQDGAPVSDVLLRIAFEDVAAGVEMREARTGADGHFLFEQLPPGLATVKVLGSYRRGATELAIEIPPDAHVYQDIALDSGISIQLTLENAPAIVQPIVIAAFPAGAGALDYASAHDGASAMIHAAPGAPAVLSGLEPGDYTVVAWAFMEDGSASIASVEITLGDTPEAALTLAF